MVVGEGLDLTSLVRRDRTPVDQSGSDVPVSGPLQSPPGLVSVTTVPSRTVLGNGDSRDRP